MSTLLEARTLSKIRSKIIPFAGLLFVLNFLDRVNIGFAALRMNQDLGFSASVYGFGAGVFFISYALCEVPSNLILNRIGPKIWISRIMITWGVISSCFAVVQGETGFYVLRFLLGVAEAGFVPGIVLYFSNWFPSHHRARAFAGFFGASQLAYILGAPFSGWLLDAADGLGGLAGWRWLFVLEGLPSVAVGILVLFRLTDRPADAGWLEPEEKKWIIGALDEERRLSPPAVHPTIGRFLRDRTVLALTAIYFFFVISAYGLTFWLPQIIKTFGGLTSLQIGLLSSVPYICAMISLLVVGAHSDRTGERKFHIAGCALLGAVFLVASSLVSSPLLAFLLLCVAAFGIWGQNGVFWTLPTAYLSGTAAAGGIAFINSVAQFGGFFGPFLIGWLKDTTGGFGPALVALAGSSVIVSIIAASLRIGRGERVPLPEPAVSVSGRSGG